MAIVKILPDMNPMAMTITLAVIVMIFVMSVSIKMILHGTQFFEFIDRKRKGKIAAIEEYLGEGKRTSPYMKEFMVDIRDSLYFKEAVGVYAEEKRRRGLIMLHKKLSDEIGWAVITRAERYITISNNMSPAVRKLNFYELAAYWLNIFIGLAVLLLSFAWLILLIFLKGTAVEKFGGFGIFVIFMFITAWFFMQNSPENSAKKIDKLLNKNK